MNLMLRFILFEFHIHICFSYSAEGKSYANAIYQIYFNFFKSCNVRKRFMIQKLYKYKEDSFPIFALTVIHVLDVGLSRSLD